MAKWLAAPRERSSASCFMGRPRPAILPVPNYNLLVIVDPLGVGEL
jgi:hypothetical protein